MSYPRYLEGTSPIGSFRRHDDRLVETLRTKSNAALHGMLGQSAELIDRLRADSTSNLPTLLAQQELSIMARIKAEIARREVS